MKKLLLILILACLTFSAGCGNGSLTPIETAATTPFQPTQGTTTEPETEPEETTGAADTGEIYLTNFEDGSTNGFKARGGNSVKGEITREESNSGSYSFKVSGRTQAWNGATIDVTRIFSKIDAYSFEVRAWVKLPSDAEPCNIRLSAQINFGTDETYQYLEGDESNKFVSPGDGWVELIGYGIWTKSTYDILNIYVETSNEGATNTLYIDDISIVEA